MNGASDNRGRLENRLVAGLPSPAIVVACIWLAATLAALILAQKNTSLFHPDEVPIIPCMVGSEPITWNGLWSQLNEHRIPLPRLLMLGAYAVSGGDFRGPQP